MGGPKGDLGHPAPNGSIAAQSITWLGVGQRASVGPEPAQEGLGLTSTPTRRRSSRPSLAEDRSSGPDDLPAVDVDQLMIEHVARQQHLALAPLEVEQVEEG